MYGKPLKPSECKFTLFIDDEDICLSIEDITDPSNDDVREVNYPDFDKYWDNVMENVFTSNHFKSLKDAKDWCLSIGMIENDKVEEEF